MSSGNSTKRWPRAPVDSSRATAGSDHAASPPPAGPSKASAAWWRQVTEAFELSAGDIRPLEGICRAWDRVEQLRAEIDEQGVSVLAAGGAIATNPLLIEERQQREQIRRTLATLSIPVSVEAGGPVMRAKTSSELPVWGKFAVGSHLARGQCMFHGLFPPGERDHTREQLRAAWKAYKDKVYDMPLHGKVPWAAREFPDID